MKLWQCSVCGYCGLLQHRMCPQQLWQIKIPNYISLAAGFEVVTQKWEWCEWGESLTCGGGNNWDNICQIGEQHQQLCHSLCQSFVCWYIEIFNTGFNVQYCGKCELKAVWWNKAFKFWYLPLSFELPILLYFIKNNIILVLQKLNVAPQLVSIFLLAPIFIFKFLNVIYLKYEYLTHHEKMS